MHDDACGDQNRLEGGVSFFLFSLVQVIGGSSDLAVLCHGQYAGTGTPFANTVRSGAQGENSVE